MTFKGNPESIVQKRSKHYLIMSSIKCKTTCRLTGEVYETSKNNTIFSLNKSFAMF